MVEFRKGSKACGQPFNQTPAQNPRTKAVRVGTNLGTICARSVHAIGGGMYVYVMQAGSHVKIGIASDVEARRSSISTGNANPVRVVKTWAAMSAAPAIERRAHCLLAACRANGEWFSCSPEAAIAAVEEALQETPKAPLWKLMAEYSVLDVDDPLDRERRDEILASIHDADPSFLPQMSPYLKWRASRL